MIYESFRSLGYFFFNPIVHLGLWALVFLYYFIFNKNPRRTSLFFILYVFIMFSKPLVQGLTNSLQLQVPSSPYFEQKQAVVILTGGIVLYDNSHLHYQWGPTASRLLEGYRLFQKTRSHLLIFVGGSPYPHPQQLSEVASMKKWALEMGVPEDQIRTEDLSTTTYENALLSKKILQENGVDDFYLVTSAIHMPRALATFRTQKLQPTPYPVERKSFEDASFWSLAYLSQSLEALKEWVGFFAYKVTGKI